MYEVRIREIDVDGEPYGVPKNMRRSTSRAAWIVKLPHLGETYFSDTEYGGTEKAFNVADDFLEANRPIVGTKACWDTFKAGVKIKMETRRGVTRWVAIAYSPARYMNDRKLVLGNIYKMDYNEAVEAIRTTRLLMVHRHDDHVINVQEQSLQQYYRDVRPYYQDQR